LLLAACAIIAALFALLLRRAEVLRGAAADKWVEGLEG
jgi:hypothetical protein